MLLARLSFGDRCRCFFVQTGSQPVNVAGLCAFRFAVKVQTGAQDPMACAQPGYVFFKNH